MPLGIARGIILVMMLLLGLLPLLIINASLLALAISLCRLHRVTASTQFGRTPVGSVKMPHWLQSECCRQLACAGHCDCCLRRMTLVCSLGGSFGDSEQCEDAAVGIPHSRMIEASLSAGHCCLCCLIASMLFGQTPS